MPAPRTLVWILPDQLTVDHPALDASLQSTGVAETRVVLIESQAALRRLPYHTKRQTLLLSAGRHFAAELKQRGLHVEIMTASDTKSGLARAVKRHRPASIETMASTEYAIRRWQVDRAEEALGVPVTTHPNAMFLCEQFAPFPHAAPDQHVVMERFYRRMRQHFNLLIEADGSPAGGTWNFDAQNRRPLPKGQKAPPRLRCEPDAITRRVMREVEQSGHGVGSTAGFDLPVTRAQAEAAFQDFLAHRLPDFGPYEDAMSRGDGMLYHSMLSPQMNLGLLEPLAMCRAAEHAYRSGHAPLNSVEGFIRQIIGWREFIYWQYHRQMPGLRAANHWAHRRPMPAMFWNAQTDMGCIRTIVERLIETGFNHHIERLMVICNFCMLAGVEPAAVADWFLTFYVDSHDWVVLPNVIGMGLNADGGITATKPYIASAAYINKMSDFCGSCRYDPKQRTGAHACPFNTLYWNFLIEHERSLRSNPRMGPNVLGLRHLKPAERRVVRQEAAAFLEALEPYVEADAADPAPSVRQVEVL